ncbi:MAG: thiamine-phosphate pyrophosphorylase [Pelagibacterales bacterium]|nr:thiamine-phosphate pyrophosphorylase [Pelagibacterales bacterium]|tara:strand:- start:150 stop:725 length:576 start_codon:yes stop_codon:yes gene_type:complete
MHRNLPKSFIFIDKYSNKIFTNNSTKVAIIYRNYGNERKEKELSKIAKACKQKRFLLFVSNNIKLAIKFKADGLYIPSFIKAKMYTNLEKKNLIILGSAHNQKEIFQKISQRCDGIFLSPIFHINKRNTYLDLHKFNYLANSNNIKFFALGGINDDNICKLKLLSINGFGGITVFKKKPAYKRPVFKNLIL